MKNLVEWLTGAGVGLIVVLGLAACSDSSDESAGGGAGAGPGSPPEIEEARSNLQRDTNPEVADTDYQSFVSSTNDFGLDVFAELTTSDTNVVFSPVSVAVALGMTYAGARNDTAAQMSAVMHNELSDEAFHAANNQLALDLDSRNIALHETAEGDKNVLLRLVNATWAQNNYEFLQPFLDILARDYDAGMKLLDFQADPEGSRQIINDWVAYQTEDRIEDLIGPDAITVDTKLVLTNALYFYASWNQVFNAESTSDGTFYTLSGSEVTTEMMHQTNGLLYAEGDGYQLVELPYDGSQLAMTVVLPEADRFLEIRDALSDDWLEQARASMSTTQVQLTLPKFSFTWGTESLKDPLIELGMTDAFEYPIADFTGMNPTGELYVGDVLHQAFIAVDESGTEAAAATAVIMTLGGMPASPVEFSVDRPFFFFIRDSSGVLLFTGQVTDPTR
jgi:serpin B